MHSSKKITYNLLLTNKFSQLCSHNIYSHSSSPSWSEPLSSHQYHSVTQPSYGNVHHRRVSYIHTTHFAFTTSFTGVYSYAALSFGRFLGKSVMLQYLQKLFLRPARLFLFYFSAVKNKRVYPAWQGHSKSQISRNTIVDV